MLSFIIFFTIIFTFYIVTYFPALSTYPLLRNILVHLFITQFFLDFTLSLTFFHLVFPFIRPLHPIFFKVTQAEKDRQTRNAQTEYLYNLFSARSMTFLQQTLSSISQRILYIFHNLARREGERNTRENNRCTKKYCGLPPLPPPGFQLLFFPDSFLQFSEQVILSTSVWERQSKRSPRRWITDMCVFLYLKLDFTGGSFAFILRTLYVSLVGDIFVSSMWCTETIIKETKRKKKYIIFSYRFFIS